jgi:hypothetical protein
VWSRQVGVVRRDLMASGVNFGPHGGKNRRHSRGRFLG